ncbi:hypothetical protein IX38_20770 [Chryseobacterium luteum]|uniref:Uncharacterized protein n=1 Tax=Chryseobacterium luteum TaxID=421531 RepID=A0A085YYL7_9FLAO|nr:hypothetical protein IX38_20770 [Chryseobacterium luteum]
MKNTFGEKHKLPLTFKNITKFGNVNNVKRNSNTAYFLESKKYRSDFYIREKPFKSLTRLL